MRFLLGLKMGGLMEDPAFHVEHLLQLEAPTLREAKLQFAHETRPDGVNAMDQLPDWDAQRLTYYGWSIVQIVDAPA